MTIVQTAHVIMRITLVGVAIMLIGTVLLIFDLVVGRSAALIAAGATLLVVIIIAVLPAVVRSNGQPAQSQDGPTKIS
jgi:membrane-bound ClpP family serine protease